ncbi:MAG: tetratricopeptide repeat protein [Thermodesulfobacteriota bacterium]
MTGSYGWRLLCVVVLLISVTACGSKEDKVQKFMSKGQALYEQGEYVKATLEFRNALQIDPKHARAYYMLGMANLKQGELRSAFGGFNKAVELDPENLEAHLEAANLSIAGAMFDEAETQLSFVLERQPDNERALLMQGAVLLETQGIDIALDHLQQLQKKGIESVNLYVQLADIHQRRKDRSAAEKTLRDGLAKHQDSVLLHLQLANLLASEGKIDEAIAMMEKVVALVPENTQYSFALAGIYLQDGRKEEAVAKVAATIADAKEEAQARRDAAGFFLRAGLGDEAEKVLRDGIAKLPEDTSLRLALAAYCIGSDRADEALETYNGILSLGLKEDDPGVIAAQVGLAEMHLRKGELEEGRKLLAEVIGKSPKNIDAHYLKGKAELMAGDFAAAVPEFRMAVTERPENAVYHLDLVQAHLLNSEPKLAREALEKAAKVFVDSKEVQGRLIRMLAGLGEKDKALRAAEHLRSRYPEDEDVLAQLADMQVAAGQKEAAIRLYQSLKGNERTAPFASLRLSQVHLMAGEKEKAKAEVENGLERAPDSDPLLAQAVKIAGADFQAAMAYIEARLSRNDKDPFAHNLAGAVYANGKNEAEAMAHFKRAAELAPQWPDPLNNLAMYSLRLGRKDEAIEFLKKTLAVNSTDRMAYSALGALYEQSGEYDKAIAIYEEALGKDPNLWDAANNLAFLLVEAKGEQADIDRALALVKKAAAQQPDTPSILDTLGWVYFKKGEYQRALSHLSMALDKLKQPPAVLHYHLGMALLKNGRNAEAKSHLEKALERQENFPGRSEAESQLQGIS